MDKTLFCDSLRALRAQYEHDRLWGETLASLFPNERLFGIYDNSKVNNALLHILQLEMNDACKDSWIEYFCFELDFGAKYREGCASQYGKNIDLSSPETLYDHLKSLQDGRQKESTTKADRKENEGIAG